MVRILAFLVGCGFAVALLIAAVMPREAASPNVAAKFFQHPKEVHFSSDGVMGKFDRAQLQRGMQVFKDVCSSCHALKHLSFYELEGLGYTPGQIKAIAADWPIQVSDIDSGSGDMIKRKPLPSDKVPAPFANEAAARNSNGGALPPDLSLMTKARHEGPAYVYSILTGYQDVPADLPKDLQPGAGKHYNPYFASLNIGMPKPLVADGQVAYSADGNPKATVDQMAQDVASFLTWAAEPNLEKRHQIGWAVLAFLLAFAVLCWMSYQSIWADKKH